ncbi:MAG TPA: methionine biosynthesis protein MetW [Acidimicrobiales bacterium]|nr:methionine biosynthesis protein MetW [Acidimicrobiales bacterium]
MSSPLSPPDGAPSADGPNDNQVAAASALRAAFERLQPQGSDAWNFLAAFTHLGDRYGPYQPGASGLSALLGDAARSPAAGTGLRGRLQRGRGDGAAAPAGGQSELEQAMAQVVEAFRFLSARVGTLEARLARQDQPVDGPAWLVPAAELGEWVELVSGHMADATPGGDVLHGDCGEGHLLRALQRVGITAVGVEPRGGVALRALEQGSTVVINEVTDELAARSPASLGGVVLSGVVDRLPLHALLALLDQARRTLTLGAPIVVLATEPATVEREWGSAARDLVLARPLHGGTWAVLLERAGFVNPVPLGDEGMSDGRFAVSATVPT